MDGALKKSSDGTEKESIQIFFAVVVSFNYDNITSRFAAS